MRWRPPLRLEEGRPAIQCLRRANVNTVGNEWSVMPGRPGVGLKALQAHYATLKGGVSAPNSAFESQGSETQGPWG